MADFSNLYDVDPFTATLMLSRNQRSDLETQRLRQQELAETISKMQAEAGLAQQMDPLKLEAARLANQQARAQLPGVEAQSILQRLKAQREQGTLDTDISAGISANEETVSKNQAAQRDRIGKAFLSLAPELNTIPDLPGQRASRVRNFLTQEIGIPESHPQFIRLMDIVKNTPSSDLPKVLSGIGKQLAQQDPQYIRDLDRERVQQEGATSRQAMQIAGQKELEGMRINAGKYNRGQTATNVNTALMKARNAAQAAEILENAYYEATNNNDMQAAQIYQQRAQAARQRAAEDAANRGAATPRVDLGQYNIPQMPGPAAQAPIAGQGGVSQIPQGNSIEAAVKAKGEQFRPDLYEYRIGPNGAVQKRPKRSQ